MCIKSHRNQIFCFWPRGQEVFWGNQILLRKEYLSKFSVTKMKKTLVMMSQKLLYCLCICKQKKWKAQTQFIVNIARDVFRKIFMRKQPAGPSVDT